MTSYSGADERPESDAALDELGAMLDELPPQPAMGSTHENSMIVPATQVIALPRLVLIARPLARGCHLGASVWHGAAAGEVRICEPPA